MADYDAVARSRHKTLVGATRDKVTFAAEPEYVEVVNRSTVDAVYFTVANRDGTDPTVEGDDTYFLPPGGSLIVVGGTVVELISAGNAPYSVQAIDP